MWDMCESNKTTLFTLFSKKKECWPVKIADSGGGAYIQASRGIQYGHGMAMTPNFQTASVPGQRSGFQPVQQVSNKVTAIGKGFRDLCLSLVDLLLEIDSAWFMKLA